MYINKYIYIYTYIYIYIYIYIWDRGHARDQHQEKEGDAGERGLPGEGFFGRTQGRLLAHAQSKSLQDAYIQHIRFPPVPTLRSGVLARTPDVDLKQLFHGINQLQYHIDVLCVTWQILQVPPYCRTWDPRTAAPGDNSIRRRHERNS